MKLSDLFRVDDCGQPYCLFIFLMRCIVVAEALLTRSPGLPPCPHTTLSIYPLRSTISYVCINGMTTRQLLVAICVHSHSEYWFPKRKAIVLRGFIVFSETTKGMQSGSDDGDRPLFSSSSHHRPSFTPCWRACLPLFFSLARLSVSSLPALVSGNS